MNINDTYLVVDIESKAVFGHYDTPGKAKGQVKRKGDRWAVYVVTAVEPLIHPKKVIEDLTEVEYCETLDYCKIWMKDGMVGIVQEDTPHGCCGEDTVSEVFKFQGKFYEITVEIQWDRYDKQFYYIDGSRVVSCEECDEPS